MIVTKTQIFSYKIAIDFSKKFKYIEKNVCSFYKNTNN